MVRSFLSNVEVRSNLVPRDYFQTLPWISALEVLDVLRRNPNLETAENLLTAQQKADLKDRLFWGRNSVRMTEDGRQLRWLEKAAGAMDDALRALEERPCEETAFELLAVAEQLRRQWRDPATEGLGQRAVEADEWTDRIREVLERRCRLPGKLIDERLERILGFPLPPLAVPTPKPVPVPAPQPLAVPPPAPSPAAVPAAADERWAAVQAAWPGLPEHVKQAILLLVEAARVTAAAGK